MQNTTPVHPVERFLAILAAVVCLAVTVVIWLSVSAYQPMWPLPALYFIELPVLAIFSACMFARGTYPGATLIWAALGVFMAFSVMGAFSVGFFYLPVALIFAIIAISATVRSKRSVALNLCAFLVAGIAQGVLMLALIRLI